MSKDVINVKFEKWQIKALREYFGRNDKTHIEHWAFSVFDKAFKQLTPSPTKEGKQ